MNNENQNITFEDAEEMVRAALKGTAFAEAQLEEWGGGDGPEDIKPFRIAQKNGVDFGATVFPDGGMLFWVWSEDGEQEEFETFSEAIAVFNK